MANSKKSVKMTIGYLLENSDSPRENINIDLFEELCDELNISFYNHNWNCKKIKDGELTIKKLHEKIYAIYLENEFVAIINNTKETDIKFFNESAFKKCYDYVESLIIKNYYTPSQFIDLNEKIKLKS